MARPSRAWVPAGRREENSGLTPREVELLEVFAKGESYKEAARILGESINFSRKGQNALHGNTPAAAAPQAQKVVLKTK